MERSSGLELLSPKANRVIPADLQEGNVRCCVGRHREFHLCQWNHFVDFCLFFFQSSLVVHPAGAD